LFAATRRSEVA